MLSDTLLLDEKTYALVMEVQAAAWKTALTMPRVDTFSPSNESVLIASALVLEKMGIACKVANRYIRIDHNSPQGDYLEALEFEGGTVVDSRGSQGWAAIMEEYLAGKCSEDIDDPALSPNVKSLPPHMMLQRRNNKVALDILSICEHLAHFTQSAQLQEQTPQVSAQRPHRL